MRAVSELPLPGPRIQSNSSDVHINQEVTFFPAGWDSSDVCVTWEKHQSPFLAREWEAFPL